MAFGLLLSANRDLLQRCTREESPAERRTPALRSRRFCEHRRCARPARGPARDWACPRREGLAEKAYQNEEEKIEAGEKRGGQIDVLAGRFLGVVPTEQRIRRAEQRHASVQRGLDACLAQRDCLLLHHLGLRDPPNSTSWIEVRSPSLILSNSSMQQIPVSARISAPPSTFSSSVSGSRITPAVNPTLEDPLPYTSLFPAIPTVVYTPRGAAVAIYFRSCDLATPGSPISSTLISPRIFIPSSVTRVTPPWIIPPRGSYRPSAAAAPS